MNSPYSAGQFSARISTDLLPVKHAVIGLTKSAAIEVTFLEKSNNIASVCKKWD
jgi:hypothetical protein